MNFLTDEPVDTDEYMCHQTRPVLLPTGWADIPYPWHPSVVDIGIYQIGNFYILSGWFLRKKQVEFTWLALAIKSKYE